MVWQRLPAFKGWPNHTPHILSGRAFRSLLTVVIACSRFYRRRAATQMKVPFRVLYLLTNLDSSFLE